MEQPTQASESDEGAETLQASAPRRTLLAAERTYLAWFRTGLAALGVSLAVGRLIPALIQTSTRDFTVLGVGYGLLGVFLIAFAALRMRNVHRALASGTPLTPDWWATLVLTVYGLVLAVATVAVILAI